MILYYYYMIGEYIYSYIFLNIPQTRLCVGEYEIAILKLYNYICIFETINISIQ